MNTDLVPNYADIFDFLKNEKWNSVDGVSYGGSADVKCKDDSPWTQAWTQIKG